MLICDGCKVVFHYEHRCHGETAVVEGDQTGRPCECQPCRFLEFEMKLVDKDASDDVIRKLRAGLRMLIPEDEDYLDEVIKEKRPQFSVRD